MVHSVGDAVQIAGAQVARSTVRGIQLASAQSGVSFQYLLAKASQESSFDADAGATTSSAKGLFQFTKGTWLEVLKRHGDELGLGDVASRIMSSPGGRLRVLDKASEEEILGLRVDPKVSSLAAAAYARDNSLALESAIGRTPDAPDLYLAHFLGPTGAGAMLNAAADAPNIYAAHIAPAAARANPAVFYGASGTPRTVADVVALIRDRFENQLDRVSDVAAAWAGEDSAQALKLDRGAPPETALKPHTASRAPSMFDLKDAVGKSDPNRMALSWYMLEELTKMIANQPMSMSGMDGTDEDAANDTALPASGFGGDWASALTKSFVDDAGLSGRRRIGRRTLRRRCQPRLHPPATAPLIAGAPCLRLGARSLTEWALSSDTPHYEHAHTLWTGDWNHRRQREAGRLLEISLVRAAAELLQRRQRRRRCAGHVAARFRPD